MTSLAQLRADTKALLADPKGKLRELGYDEKRTHVILTSKGLQAAIVCEQDNPRGRKR